MKSSALSKQREHRVTIALDINPDPFLREEALRRGWRLLNLQYCGCKTFPWIKCHGALLTGNTDTEIFRSLMDVQCKIVRISELGHIQGAQFPRVLKDYAAYGRKAAEHFHERQFHDVAYVGRDPWSNMQILYEGFSRRAAELGMECHLLRFKSELLAQPNTPEQRYLQRQTKFAEWIKDVPKPLGLLAYGDYAAAELCFMIAQAGLDVPTDIAVLSNGNDEEICEGAMTPLSSFANDWATRVRIAADILARWLDGEAPPRKPVMVPPGEIIERASTNVLAVSDRTVARTLRFIWEHFEQPLTVNDIAKAVAVSRRKLDRLFHRHFSRSVKAELNRKRLEKCRQLLKDADLNIAEIAEATGFSSSEYLREAFRAKYAVSPRKYRNEHHVS